MSSKRGSCHSAKCRRMFLNQSINSGNSKDVTEYFKLMTRLGRKDQRFIKYLKSDLKHFVQKGGRKCNEIEEEEECSMKNNQRCIWDYTNSGDGKCIHINSNKAKELRRKAEEAEEAKEAELAELEAELAELEAGYK